MTDQLPSGYTYVDSNTTTGTYNAGTGLWNIGDLANEAAVTLTIEATVLENGTYLNTAVVDGFEPDPDITNNTSSAAVTLAVRSIALVKTGEYVDTNEDGIVNAGDHIRYTFTVTNTGETDITNVVISDQKLGISGFLVSSSLAPETTASVTRDYALTASDIGNGLVENSAVASGNDPQDNTISDTSGTDTENDDPTLVYLLIANDDDYSGDSVSGNPNLGNVLDNDKIGEDDVTIEDVTITIVTPADPVSGGANVPEIDPETGIVSLPGNTPVGTYTITYEICSADESAADNCDQATVTVTVTTSGTITIDLTGGPCWRMLSSPTQGTTYADMLDNIWTQGAEGSDFEGNETHQPEPNVFTWDTDNQTWAEVTNLNNVIPAGTGFIVSVFELDDFEDPASGGWNKTLEIPEGSEHPAPFSAPFGDTDEGEWTLLGNPFHSNIDTDILTANASDITSAYYVYDRQEGSGWVSTAEGYGELTDGAIAVGQGFFVQANGTNPSLDFTQDSRTEEGEFYGKETQPRDFVRLEVQGEGISNSMWIRFSDNGSYAFTAGDALKLESMSEEYAILASRKTDDTLLDIGHYPYNSDLTIPVNFRSTQAGTYMLTAENLDLPAGASLYFTDLHTSQTMPVNEQFEYSFTMDQPAKRMPAAGREMNLCQTGPQMAKTSGSDRFLITVSAPNDSGHKHHGELPTKTSLEQNFPNPFNPSTIIRYNLAETSDVQLDIFDTLGRRVATLVEGTISAGAHTVNFDASGLNSGVYFYRLTAQNQVFSKQMILVK